MSETQGKVQDKDHLGIVIVGHVDAGKSTTTGHLLFELGGISERDMEKLKAEAEAKGKSSFMFAFFTDKQKDEQERGITITCTTKEFFTSKKHFTLIDAPGHKDFIKNMIRGASQADVALLMVPASGFEEAIAKGDRKKNQVEGQTRQHAMLCNLLGIQQMIVGINKMDDPSVKYSESRFNEIKDEVIRMLKQVGWKNKLADPDKGKEFGEIPVIPMSGWTGENLTKPSENMPWYKGFQVNIEGKDIKGHTLIDALENVVQIPKRPVNKELRMPVSGLLKIGGVGDVVTGRIEQGILKVDDKVCFAPSGIKGRVFSIEMHHRQVQEAGPGDNVGVNIKGLCKEASAKPKEGNIMIIDKGTDEMVVESFRVAVMVQEHPGQLKASKDGKGGFTPMVMIRTAKVAAQLSAIHWKKGKTSTGGVKLENAEFVEKGDAAEVTFTPKQPIYLNKFTDCAGLGRVAVMDSNSLIMLGKVVDVTWKKQK
jgi:elongation factor 1-alpha